MGYKSLNRIMFIYFLNCLRFGVSIPTATMESELKPNISDVEGIRSAAPYVEMPVLIKRLKATLIPAEVTEGSNNLVTRSDLNPDDKDSICLDNASIMPRADGRPGSRTIPEILDFGDNWVPIRCFWPIAVAWDSAVEISIRIEQSDWHLPCTVWNLTLKYGFDPEQPMTRTTIVCPNQRRRIVRIPREAKRATAILEGLVSRSPRFSLHWTYLNVSKITENEFVAEAFTETPWGELMVIVGCCAVFVVFFICLCFYDEWKKRRAGPAAEDRWTSPF